MTQDSEKRFHSIMDRLFHSTQSTSNSNSASSPSSSPSGVQLARGKKRPYSSSELVLGELRSRGDVIEAFQLHSSVPPGSSDSPLCRPWDREDLLQRLTTFKSMTWFGKPKVVSAVNCARRGWINVDMDTIACESCGARLFFSTPSSWNQQQVEKAALVFSLKLDNGHKLLCPWIDNACDEGLAEFPPIPPPILVNRFRERYSVLLQLSALPVISSSFMKWMKSPHLEQFLEESSLLEFGDESLNKSEIEYLGNGHDSNTTKSYYQALKLISLFGWELRSLPYLVDCKIGSTHCTMTSNISDSLHPIVNLHSTTTNANVDGNGIVGISSEMQHRPNSVVLDCKFCGASVGLWAFRTVPRPVEIIRLVGPTELNNESGAHNLGSKNCINHAGIGTVETSSTEGRSSLTSTIAGGPTPARQNFKATITLPIVGQNLRARLFNDKEFNDLMYNEQDTVETYFQDKNLSRDGENNNEGTPTELIVLPEDKRVLQSRTFDHGCHTNDDLTPSEGTDVTEQGTFPESDLHGSIDEPLVESRENVPVQKNEIPENVENSGELDSVKISSALDPANKEGKLDPGPSSSSIENSFIITDVDDMIKSLEFNENEIPSTVVSDNCDLLTVLENDPSNSKDASLATLQVPPRNSSCLEDDRNTGIISKNELTEGKPNYDNCITSGNHDKVKVQTSMNSELITHGGENYLKHAPLDKIMEFDPLGQHRHFCAWIATGNLAPGWKQTLTALQRQKNSSMHSPKNSPSASLIKVDDPVKSVRNLFTSSAKKLKSSLSSNGNSTRRL